MSRADFPTTVRIPAVAGLLVVALSWGALSGCSQDPEGGDQPAENQQTDVDAGPDADPDPSDSSPDANDGSGGDGDRPDQNSGEEWDWEDEEFEIRSVIPARGPVEGGTRVEIAGAELTDSTEVWFGDQLVETELSDGRLVGETPPASNRGPVTVRLVSTSGRESTLTNGFTYTDPVEIDEVAPDVLPTTGGVEIDVSGTGFDDQTGMTFSGTPARRIDVVDEGLARVVPPPMPEGPATLSVATPYETTTVEEAVYFFEPLDIEALQPAAGPVGGGQTVEIHGRGLGPETEVRFGDESAEVVSYSGADKTLTVLTPPGAATGPVDVEIESPFDVTTREDGFVYDRDSASDQLYSVAPPTATVGQQSEHVVSGRGLDETGIELVVGGQSATVVDAGPHHARIELPTFDQSGPVDVVLLQNGTEIDRLDGAVDVRPALEIDDVTPAAGPADGGQTVTISGTGLQGVEAVEFGGLDADAEFDGGQLTATTPRSEPGVVDIVVDDGDRRVAADDAYTFESDLEVWSMQPSRGAVAGNTRVTLRGRGFVGPIGVDVGDQAADDIRRHDVYTVTFRTPPSATIGDREVDVSVLDEETSPPYPFVYYDPLDSFGGAHGPSIEGAIDVSVIDFNGNPIPDAFVMLSTDAETPHRGYTDANGQITLSGPGVIGPQTVTATAADMSTVTVREIDARHLTLVLNPVEPQGGDPGDIPPPPMAHFEGTVELTGKKASAEGREKYNMSIVETTRNAVGTPTMSPGQDSVVEGGEGDYEIRSRVGDLALVAMCGVYDDETEKFTPKTMGVRRNITASDGDRRQIDLKCDIPLDSSIPVKLADPIYAPDGPTRNRVEPYLDFGYEGVFPMPEPTTGLADILEVGPLPAPEGPLDNVTYSLVAGSYTGGGMPYSRTTLRDVPDVGQLATTAPLVAVPDMLAPAPGGVVGDQIWLGQNGVNAPDFKHLTLNNSMGLPVWTFIVPGEDSIVPMPEFPSFAQLPIDERPQPYVDGSLFGLAYAPAIAGFDYDSFNWADLDPGGWTTFAVDSWQVSLTDD